MKPGIFSYLQSVDILAFQRKVSEFATNVYQMLNGNLLFKDNFKSSTIGSFALSSSGESIITHNLGVIPVGFIIVNTDTTGFIYSGTTAWTKTTISLKTSAVIINCTIIVIAG